MTIQTRLNDSMEVNDGLWPSGIHVKNISGEEILFAIKNSGESSRLLSQLIISILLSGIILTTIIGNVFVLAAIFIERNLQTVGNFLVLSLGIADLLVACLVMPLAAVNEVRQQWPLGALLCDMWTCCDVLCCTASILHLLAIAWDRYRTVTSVCYVRRRNGAHIRNIILLVWSVSVVISSAPILGWRDIDFERRIANHICIISQDASYQMFATASSFYAPLTLTLFLYWRIYQVARTRIRHKPGLKVPLTVTIHSGLTSCELSDTHHRNIPLVCQDSSAISVIHIDSPRSSTDCDTINDTPRAAVSYTTTTFQGTWQQNSNEDCSVVCATSERSNTLNTQNVIPMYPKGALEIKREKKAAKTLAIITGVFVVCWLPFFVHALLKAFCGELCEVPRIVSSLFLWLGYMNSMLNPIIYTLFSPDFRNAFHKILCGKRRLMNLGQHIQH